MRIKPYKKRPYPRIMANDSSLEKYAAPGSTVTVSFPTVIDFIDKLQYYSFIIARSCVIHQ